MRGQDSNFVVKVMGETKTLFIPGCGFNSAIECDEKPIMQEEKIGEYRRHIVSIYFI